MSKLYAPKELYKKATLSIMGQKVDVPFDSMDKHCVGVIYVYDDRKAAAESASTDEMWELEFEEVLDNQRDKRGSEDE